VEFIEVLLDIDSFLALYIKKYGILIYFILFFIIFAETGLVVTPFLPGDSLLFAIGAVAATGSMEIKLIAPLLMFAAILGNAVNYRIGYTIGPKIFRRENVRFLDKKSLEKTKLFYEKYGGKAIILSRFLPIFRTFVPFVAGIGKMNYGKFMSYNLIGGSLWVLFFILGGYYFGNISYVQNNFGLVIIGIVVVSLIPSVVEYLKYRNQISKEK